MKQNALLRKKEILEFLAEHFDGEGLYVVKRARARISFWAKNSTDFENVRIVTLQPEDEIPEGDPNEETSDE